MIFQSLNEPLFLHSPRPISWSHFPCHLFIDLLWIFFWFSSLLEMYSCSFRIHTPPHRALLEARTWTPHCCITWEPNWTLFVSINIWGSQDAGSDIINTQGRWQSVLVHDVCSHTHTHWEKCGHSHIFPNMWFMVIQHAYTGRVWMFLALDKYTFLFKPQRTIQATYTNANRTHTRTQTLTICQPEVLRGNFPKLKSRALLLVSSSLPPQTRPKRNQMCHHRFLTTHTNTRCWYTLLIPLWTVDPRPQDT